MQTHGDIKHAEGIAAQRTNTEFERIALTGGINLSDGHARMSLDSHQKAIAHRRLVDAFDGVSPWHDQSAAEHEFLTALFTAGGQEGALNAAGIYLTFSSSSAIRMAAAACRSHGLKILLIEPCFDNIYHLIRGEGIEHVEAVSEGQVTMNNLEGRLCPQTALWLVQPNNPTGWTLLPDEFRRIVELCSETGATLICDFAFRWYSPLLLWDQYRLVLDAGCDFIFFEDIGKVLPTREVKVGVTVSSTMYAHTLHRLHDELLLSVSPVALGLIAGLLGDIRERGRWICYRRAIEVNRLTVHRLVASTNLRHPSSNCLNVPLEMVSLPDDIDLLRFWETLRSHGVEVLPGNNYYWASNEDRLGGFFRIPLSRSHEDLSIACQTIANCLEP